MNPDTPKNAFTRPLGPEITRKILAGAAPCSPAGELKAKTGTSGGAAG